MRKLQHILLALLMLFACNACTLMLEEYPYEEETERNPGEFDVDHDGFDAPYTQVVEDLGTVTFQYGDSTRVFVTEMFDYIVDVQDSIIYLSDNIPTDLLIRPGYYVSRPSCLEFPAGLNHKVVGLEHANGMYAMAIEYANAAAVFKEYSADLTASLSPSEDIRLKMPDPNDPNVIEINPDDLTSNTLTRSSSGDVTVGDYAQLDWKFFKGQLAPISNKSPYSRKLKIPQRTRTKDSDSDDDKQKDDDDKQYKEEKLQREIELVKLKFAADDGVYLTVPYVNSALRIDAKCLGILKGADAEIGFTKCVDQDVHTLITKSIDKLGRASILKSVTTIDRSVLKVDINGEYAPDISFQKELKDTKPMGLFDKILRSTVIFFPSLVVGPFTFYVRIKPSFDVIVALNGHISFKIDNGTKETFAVFEDDEQIGDTRKKTIEKPKYLHDFEMEANGYVQTKFGIELLGGLGSQFVTVFPKPVRKVSGVGVGVYFQSDLKLDAPTSAMVKNDAPSEIPYHTSNPSILTWSNELFVRAAYWKMAQNGDATILGPVKIVSGEDETNHNLDVSLWKPNSLSYEYYPSFINFSAVSSNSTLSGNEQYDDHLTVTYNVDEQGFWHTYLHPSSNFECGVNIYEKDAYEDSKGKPIGSPEFTKYAVSFVKNSKYKFEFDLKGTQMGKEYIAVPVVRRKIYYQQYEVKELRYAAESFTHSPRPALGIYNLIQTLGSRKDDSFLVHFDFQFNATRPELFSTYWPGGVKLYLAVWGFDEARQTWKETGIIREVDLTDKIAPGRIRYDVEGSITINNPKYSRYGLSANLFHLDDKGLSYLHYVDDDGKQVNTYMSYTVFSVNKHACSKFIELSNARNNDSGMRQGSVYIGLD